MEQEAKKEDQREQVRRDAERFKSFGPKDSLGQMAAAYIEVDDLLKAARERIAELEAALRDEMQWDMGGVPENEWKRRALEAERLLAS